MDTTLGIQKMLCASLLAIAALTGSAVANADTIFGLYGSAYIWKPELGGSIGQSTDAFDVSSEFSDDKGSSNSILVAVEHPIPLIPNVQIRQTPLSWKGSSDSASGSLSDLIVVSDAEVDAELDLNMLDGTLYYELLDNWVTLDLGLTARQLDGFFQFEETNGVASDRVDVDQILPMLYGHARFDLPFTGLAAGLRGNGIAFKDNNLLDLEAYLHLEVDLIPLFDIGIQGGLRRLSLDINEDNWESEASMEGAYVAFTGHF